MGSSEDDDDKEEEERGSGDEREAAEVKRGRWCGGGGGGGDGEVGGRHGGGGGGGATVRRQGPPPGHLFLLIFLFSLLCVFHHFLFLCYTTLSNMKTDEGRRKNTARETDTPEIHRLFYHLPWNNLNGCFLSYAVLTSIKIQIHIQTSHHECLVVNGTLPNTERIISHK